jgi:hypothetical protein
MLNTTIRKIPLISAVNDHDCAVKKLSDGTMPRVENPSIAAVI